MDWAWPGIDSSHTHRVAVPPPLVMRRLSESSQVATETRWRWLAMLSVTAHCAEGVGCAERWVFPAQNSDRLLAVLAESAAGCQQEAGCPPSRMSEVGAGVVTISAVFRPSFPTPQ